MLLLHCETAVQETLLANRHQFWVKAAEATVCYFGRTLVIMEHAAQLRFIGRRYVESTSVDCALHEVWAISTLEELVYLHKARNTAAWWMLDWAHKTWPHQHFGQVVSYRASDIRGGVFLALFTLNIVHILVPWRQTEYWIKVSALLKTIQGTILIAIATVWTHNKT